MKIVFTGGGTAGHVFPILAVVREIRKIYPSPELKLFYFGPKDSYGEVLLEQEGVEIKKIFSGKIRRYFSGNNFLDFFKIPIGVIQALWKLFFLAPDVIFSKGGYGSFPTSIAAFLLRIPLILHESDIEPGLAAKITSKWALEIFTSFHRTEYFPKQKTTFLGNPIRREILNGNPQEGKEFFNLQGNRPVILILGGSQGAMAINNLILEVLARLMESYEIIHQTGLKRFKQVKTEASVLLDEEKKKFYHPIGFLNEKELKYALSCCNLVISRAGSGALFEISAYSKPVFLIPLPNSAQNHQLKNAYYFFEIGAGEVFEENNLSPHLFLEKIEYLFKNEKILQNMAQSSAGFAKPEAAEVIAQYLIRYLT